MENCGNCEGCSCGEEQGKVVPIVDENTKLEQPKEPMSPEVQAVMFIKQALPEFRRRLNLLNRSEAKRVLETLVEYPLENEAPTFTTLEGEAVFKLATMINDQKFILFVSSLEEQARKDKAEKTATETKTEGENNVQVSEVQETK